MCLAQNGKWVTLRGDFFKITIQAGFIILAVGHTKFSCGDWTLGPLKNKILMNTYLFQSVDIQ